MKSLFLQTLTTVLLIHIPLKSDTNYFGDVGDFELELNDSEIPLISQEEKAQKSFLKKKFLQEKTK